MASCLTDAFVGLPSRVLAPSWLGLTSQLGSLNPPKSMKNRSQNAFPSRHYFFIDFASLLSANFEPQTLNILILAEEKPHFDKKSLLANDIDFSSVLGANMLPFSFPKSA